MAVREPTVVHCITVSAGGANIVQRLIQILLLLQHVLLGDQVQILHETLTLMVLGLIGHVDDFTGRSLELLSAATYLLHVLGLLLILHDLPLLTLLTVDLVLLLDDEVLILLRVGEVVLLEIQVHTLQPLVVHRIYLLIYILCLVHLHLPLVPIRDALDA